MKKLLVFDWLRAVQFKCNTSAKSVTPVQITKIKQNFKKKLKTTPNQQRLNKRCKERTYLITRGDEKRRETCCRVSLFTLAELFKLFDLEKTTS